MQSINGFHFDDEFCHFINLELLPAHGSTAEFWNQFTAILSNAAPPTIPGTTPDKSEVSLLTPRYALKAINARWGSLYSALYHEDAIPQSSGLKTGQRFNVARASRVIDYAREFLDEAFPLSEGSHKDAVSYLVYFQNMMVTLADGSTVGLKNPGHFVAKSGPKHDPEALLLRNPSVHVEIRFNRNGSIGATDMASIDDIQVEAPARTILGCEASTVKEKCDALRNLQQLINGSLKAHFMRDGKLRTRRLNSDCEFSARTGETYTVKTRNPVALQLHGDSICPAVSDSLDKALPSAVVDAALFSIITSNNRNNANIALMVSGSDAYDLVKPILDQHQRDSEFGYSIELLKNFQSDTKDHLQVADTHAQLIPQARIADHELGNVKRSATQNTAVLNAIQNSYLPPS